VQAARRYTFHKGPGQAIQPEEPHSIGIAEGLMSKYPQDNHGSIASAPLTAGDKKGSLVETASADTGLPK